MRKLLVLYPFCFAVYFVLNTSTTLHHPAISTLLNASLILLVFVYLLNRAVDIFVKDKIKAGIVTTIILAPILYYPQLLQMFGRIYPGLGRHRYVLLMALVSTILLARLTINTKKRLVTLTQYLNALSFCYIIYGLVLVSNAGLKDNFLKYEDIVSTPESETKLIKQPGIKNLPDIYYIVLDGYAGVKVMKEYLNFSDHEFINSLEKRGFCVTQDSRAFAPSTVISTASTLAMSNDPRLLTAHKDVLLKMIRYNRVERFLNSKGYQTINFSFSPISDNPRFYRLVSNPDTSDLTRIFQNTLFSILVEIIELNNIYKINLKIVSSLKTTPLSRKDKPRFIYAHLLFPHTPYSFDRDANVIPLWKRKGALDTTAYIEQVLGVNKLILGVIDDILLKSGKKPIIIVQGDHGYRHGKYKENTKLSVLNAYYLPGENCDLLYPAISPYNSFRVIFNAYFKTNYPLLSEDR